MLTAVHKKIIAHPIAFALIFFCFYFAGFFGLEQLVTEPKYIIGCALDGMIPFNEWFIFAYATWFGLIPWALITLLVLDRENYFYLCAVMFSSMAISLLIYLLFPNGVQLRPDAIVGGQYSGQSGADDLGGGQLFQCLPLHSCGHHRCHLFGGAAQPGVEAARFGGWNLWPAHRPDLPVHCLFKATFGD